MRDDGGINDAEVKRMIADLTRKQTGYLIQLKTITLLVEKSLDLLGPSDEELIPEQAALIDAVLELAAQSAGKTDMGKAIDLLLRTTRRFLLVAETGLRRRLDPECKEGEDDPLDI